MDDPFFEQAESKFYNKRVLRILKQTGEKPDVVRDRGRKALLPGKRISKTGHVYWETRKNRTDDLNKKV